MDNMWKMPQCIIWVKKNKALTRLVDVSAPKKTFFFFKYPLVLISGSYVQVNVNWTMKI